MSNNFKTLCEAMVDQSVYVKYEEGLQPIYVETVLHEWVRRIINQVLMRTMFNEKTLSVELLAITETNTVVVTFKLENEDEVECIRKFDEIGELVGKNISFKVEI